MSQPRTECLDKEGKKDIACTYNTLSGLLSGLSFTVLFFYISSPLDLDILSGNPVAVMNYVTILMLITQCLLFLFASVIYSDATKIAIGAKLDVEVKYEDLIAKADNLTFIAFLMLMGTMGVVTLRLNVILGTMAIVLMVVLFAIFVKSDKAQFHSKRKKRGDEKKK